MASKGTCGYGCPLNLLYGPSQEPCSSKSRAALASTQPCNSVGEPGGGERGKAEREEAMAAPLSEERCRVAVNHQLLCQCLTGGGGEGSPRPPGKRSCATGSTGCPWRQIQDQIDFRLRGAAVFTSSSTQPSGEHKQNERNERAAKVIVCAVTLQ